MVVLDAKGLSKSVKNIYSKHRIQAHFKGYNTIKNMPVSYMARDTITQKSVMNDRIEYDEEFVRESARTLGKDSRKTSRLLPKFITM